MLGRRIDVDDDGDVIHVDAAGGDVRGDEDAHRPVAEGGEIAVACALGQVAVKVDRRDAGGTELAGELAGRVLGPGEQQTAAGARRQVGHDRGLVGRLDVEQMVLETGRAMRPAGRPNGSPGRADTAALNSCVSSSGSRSGSGK